ncbi:hypothetical protein [uncultured Gimesia sp.]|uniref:hypothetical protein n=1 Tax=uncultured Gimesia sp. TaxID=1678688 RepID=UPI0030DA6BB3
MSVEILTNPIQTPNKLLPQLESTVIDLASEFADGVEEIEIEVLEVNDFNGTAAYSNSSTGSCCQCGQF